MNKEYYCKIATKKEIAQKYDYEIKIHEKNKENWIKWKELALKNYNKNIVYIGIKNNEIICEATANITKETIQNPDKLVDYQTAYLSAFRTNKEYRGQKYFSKLFNYMIKDLKTKKYKYVTIGVEPTELKNKEIYNHWGFTEYIKTAYEENPDKTKTKVEYYRKVLKYI